MKNIIEAAWENRSLLEEKQTQDTIRSLITQLDEGKLRVAEPTENGWQVNEWVKKLWFYTFQFKKWKPWRLVLWSFTIKCH